MLILSIIQTPTSWCRNALVLIGIPPFVIRMSNKSGTFCNNRGFLAYILLEGAFLCLFEGMVAWVRLSVGTVDPSCVKPTLLVSVPSVTVWKGMPKYCSVNVSPRSGEGVQARQGAFKSRCSLSSLVWKAKGTSGLFSRCPFFVLLESSLGQVNKECISISWLKVVWNHLLSWPLTYLIQ